MPRPSPLRPLDWLLALLGGVALLWVSNLLVAPESVPFPGHGERFVAMVEDPLAFTGAFPQRILWPLLAHVAGWCGIGVLAFSHGCNAALLVGVLLFARSRGLGWLDTLLLGSAIAGTGAVQVYKQITCYSDSLNLLLMVAMVGLVRRQAWFWGLVLLASFSHENVFFFTPWLLWLRWREGARWRSELPWFVGAFVVHVGWRWFVSAESGGGSYGFLYYLQNNFWVPWLLPALWFLWLLVTLAEFGPLLAVLVWGARTQRRTAVGLTLFVGSVLLLMVLGYDVMRWAAFFVVPLVKLGADLLQRPRGRAVFACLAAAAIAVHAWQHPVGSLAGGKTFTHVGPAMVGRAAGLCIERKLDVGEHLAFGDSWQVTRESFTEHWLVALVVLASTLAVFVAGFVLARYLPGPATASGGSEPRTTTKPSA